MRKIRQCSVIGSRPIPILDERQEEYYYQDQLDFVAVKTGFQEATERNFRALDGSCYMKDSSSATHIALVLGRHLRYAIEHEALKRYVGSDIKGSIDL